MFCVSFRHHGFCKSPELFIHFCCFMPHGNSVGLCTCAQTQLCPTLCDPMDCNPPVSSIHGISPVKNTVVSCCFLLQLIFLTQESNLGLLLLHWQVDSLPPPHLGSPLAALGNYNIFLNFISFTLFFFFLSGVPRIFSI